LATSTEFTYIGPQKGLLGTLADVWEQRALIGFFAWRDLKVRYRQTLVGAGWAVLQPIVLMAIFTLFLSGIIELPTSEVSYALFVFAGLVPWTFFAQSVNQSANSIVNHQDLVRKASFSRMVLPISAVGAYLVDFLVASTVAAVWVLIATGQLHWALFALPLVAILVILTSLGVGIGLSALNVRYRDIRYGTPFLIQAWLFATPVVYPAELAPEAVRGFLYLNPMTGAVAFYRWALLGDSSLDWGAVGLSAATAMALLLLSLAYFSRSEATFADAI